MECSDNEQCNRVQQTRMTPMAREEVPDRSRVSYAEDGAVVFWFKPARTGSRGSARHRTCLPGVFECRCLPSGRCRGFDGSSMLAAAMDKLLRPLLDTSRYQAPANYADALADTLNSLEAGGCRAPRVHAANATFALRALATKFSAFDELARAHTAVQAMFANETRTFLDRHQRLCMEKGEDTKCAF